MEYQHSSKTIHNEILDLAGDEENHSFILMTQSEKNQIHNDRQVKVLTQVIMTIRYGAHCIKLGKDIQLPKIKMNTTKWNSARRVLELQHDLGLEISSFPNIGISDTNFLWELAQKDSDYNHSNENNQNK